MPDIKITSVMMDDNTLNVNKEVDMVFSIANTLRGPYKADKYKDIIIPMIIIRRLECALETKDADGKVRKTKVVEAYKKNKNTPPQILERLSGFPFYNTSAFTLGELLHESLAIVTNFKFYVKSFSPNIKEILIDRLRFENIINDLDKNNRLLGVVKKFSELDLNPETIDGHKMGYMFEEIIRRFSENAEAGDHYTPREVIRLLSSILLAEGCNDIFNEGKEITVLDMACGTGGMLSTTHDFIRRMNPDANIRLFGQENNPESYAICLADMLIKGQKADNIRFADTMREDCFAGTPMQFVIANPPFGLAWGGKDAGDGVEKAVREEAKKGLRGRFGAGLPASGDMQLLFMQHAIAKMAKGQGRAAIITNGSPLFSGNTTSGESQIRRFMLKNDLIEAIIALPSQLFYNTDIGIYAFILSKNKRKERKNKIQLINATDMWEPLKRSLGKKRREISKEQIGLITEVYAAFAVGSKTIYSEKRKGECRIGSRIFEREEFMYREWAVYQPLQRRGSIDAATIEKLKYSDYFTANSNLYNEVEFAELSETNPRDPKAEKKYQKYLRGKHFIDAIIDALEEHQSEEVYMDFAQFYAKVKDIIKGVDGYTDSRLKGVVMEMSVMDKTAVIQYDKKGNIIPDPTTKDTEIIRLNQDVDEYMKAEVLPHVPDALWFYEFNPTKKVTATNKPKEGAEFPFIQYFYQYTPPESPVVLIEKFSSLNNAISNNINSILQESIGLGRMDDMIFTIRQELAVLESYKASLITQIVTKGLDSNVPMKDSGVTWIGSIPSHWEVKRLRYILQQNENGIRVGPFGSSLKEAVTDEEHGAYKIYGQANLIRHNFQYGDNWVNEKDFLRLKNYEVLPGDVLLSMMGTIGKCSTVPTGIKKGIMDSHLIKIRLSNNMFPLYLEYVYEHSLVVYDQLILNSKGSIMNGLNSFIVKNVYLPIPPFQEQVEIAKFLDEKCGKIDAIKKSLLNQNEGAAIHAD